MSLEDKIPRRSFLKKTVTALGSIALAGWIGSGVACKSPSGTEPPTPKPPVNYTGQIRGLIRNSGISSGNVIFNNTTKVPISSGVFSINNSHNLTEGTYAVRIETAEGIPREVSQAELSNRGLFSRRTGLPIDNVIEQNSGYDINDYNNFITLAGSERWLSNKPKFFLYDKSLWTFDGSKLVVKDSNYNMSPTTIASVEYVVANHIGAFTDNFVQGMLYKERNSSERPDPMKDPAGWIIYLDQDNAIYSITRSHDDNQGDIYFGMMRFRPVPIGVWGVSIDTAQTLGIGQQWNSGQILVGTEPSPLVREFIARIIYNRAPHHSLVGGVDRE